ncbi:Mitochondrial fission 1 protein [Balamuthia mandrillaris]
MVSLGGVGKEAVALYKQNLREQRVDPDEHAEYVDELQRLERQFMQKAKDKDEDLLTHKLSLAVHLIRSTKRSHVNAGIALLQELCEEDPVKENQRVYIYYLAVAYYQLRAYRPSRECLEVLLRLEPNNRQALALHSVLEQEVTKDGLIGMGIVGAAAATAAVGGFLLIKALASK